jgi:hypothetical protein
MKIDFEKLQRFEKKHSESPVCLDSIRLMVRNVLNFRDTSFNLAPNNIQTAINTLIELEILVENESKKLLVQQLNS